MLDACLVRQHICVREDCIVLRCAWTPGAQRLLDGYVPCTRPVADTRVGEAMRIVFFGTAEFAVPSLDALLEAGHEILAVVTQPDKPQGRGRQLVASPVKQAALRHGLRVMQPRRVRAESFLAKMRDLAPDALALAAFGQVIPQALLDLPPLGPINVHGSLLPKYRGAAPIQRALMAGETTLGVTTMWMDATLDTGDMLLDAGLTVAPDDNAGTVTPRLAALGADLLIQTLAGLQAGTLPRRKQDDAQATLAPALTPEDGILPWRENASALCARVRGVTPRPGASTQINGKRVKVWAAYQGTGNREQKTENTDAAFNQATSHEPRTGRPPRSQVGKDTNHEQTPPGTIIAIQKAPPGLLVAAGEGTAVLLTEVQPENGKRMSGADWARGQRLRAGDRFDVADA